MKKERPTKIQIKANNINKNNFNEYSNDFLHGESISSYNNQPVAPHSVYQN